MIGKRGLQTQGKVRARVASAARRQAKAAAAAPVLPAFAPPAARRLPPSTRGMVGNRGMRTLEQTLGPSRSMVMKNAGLGAMQGPNPVAMAKSGKKVSRLVAGGVIGGTAIGGFKNRSGRATDRVIGRPTGVYGY
jgi:hypothetical protein